MASCLSYAAFSRVTMTRWMPVGFERTQKSRALTKNWNKSAFATGEVDEDGYVSVLSRVDGKFQFLPIIFNLTLFCFLTYIITLLNFKFLKF